MKDLEKALNEMKKALEKKSDELQEKRLEYKEGCSYECWLCGVVQGISYAIHYPYGGIAMRSDIEMKSKLEDKKTKEEKASADNCT